MLLTVEYDEREEELDVVCDPDGLDKLIKELNKLRTNGGHIHLMTPSWAGNELTEERQTPNNLLINHMRVVLVNNNGSR